MFRKAEEDPQCVSVAASQGLSSREPTCSRLPNVDAMLFSFIDQAGCPSTSLTSVTNETHPRDLWAQTLDDSLALLLVTKVTLILSLKQGVLPSSSG